MSENNQKTAFVTGAGSGLGQAMAVEFSRRAIRVVGFGRNLSSLEETKSLIGDGEFHCVAADVADFNTLEGAFKGLARSGIKPDILINNAAIYERGDLLDISPPDWMRTIDVNLGGVVNSTYLALQHMTESGIGRIINVTSFADLAPLSGSSAYSLSKGAMRLYTKTLRAELRDRFPKIIVNDWIPGALNTQMGMPEGIEPAISAQWGVSLALLTNPEINYSIFNQNQEQLPNLSMKRKIKNLLLFQPQRSPVLL